MRLRLRFALISVVVIASVASPTRMISQQRPSHFTLEGSLGLARFQGPRFYISRSLPFAEITAGIKLRTGPRLTPIATVSRGVVVDGAYDDICYTIGNDECAEKAGFRISSLLAGFEQLRPSGTSFRLLAGVGNFRWKSGSDGAVNAVRMQFDAAQATGRSSAIVGSIGYAWLPRRQRYDVPMLLMSVGLRKRSL